MSLIKKIRTDIKRKEKQISNALDDSNINIPEKKKWMSKEEYAQQKKERRELVQKGKKNQEVTNCINEILNSIIDDIIEEEEKQQQKLTFKRPKMRVRKKLVYNNNE